MESIEPYLEQLLLHKAFSELSEGEKQYVSAFLPEDTYTRIHEFLTRSVVALDTVDASLVPAPEVRVNLKRAFKAGHAKKITWPVLFVRNPFQFPAFPFGLAICAITLLVYLFYPDFTRDSPIAAGKSKIAALNGKARLPKQESEEDIQPVKTPQLSSTFRTAKIHYPIRPHTQVQNIQVKEKPPVITGLSEIESYMIAGHTVIKADTTAWEMSDPYYLSIPGLNVDLVMPESELVN